MKHKLYSHNVRELSSQAVKFLPSPAFCLATLARECGPWCFFGGCSCCSYPLHTTALWIFLSPLLPRAFSYLSRIILTHFLESLACSFPLCSCHEGKSYHPPILWSQGSVYRRYEYLSHVSWWIFLQYSHSHTIQPSSLALPLRRQPESSPFECRQELMTS